MKKYDQETKRWVEEEVLNKKQSLKTREMCRGGRPHAFELALPNYVSVLSKKLTQETVEEFYKSEDRIAEFFNSEKEKLRTLGINILYRYSRSRMRLTICAVCGKRDYFTIYCRCRR